MRHLGGEGVKLKGMSQNLSKDVAKVQYVKLHSNPLAIS